MAASPTLETATVLIIDDHPLFRKGVLRLLMSTDNLQPVGEAENGLQGIELACSLNPDLILLDLHLKGGMDGIETLHSLREKGVSSHIAVLTISDKPADIIAAVRAGADEYVLKDSEPESLLRRLQAMLFSDSQMSEEMMALLAIALREQHEVKDRSAKDLTEREIAILLHLAHGHSNKIIARELDIMESTVKVHVHNLLRKLHFQSRVEAAVWAVEQKLPFTGSDGNPPAG